MCIELYSVVYTQATTLDVLEVDMALQGHGMIDPAKVVM